MPLLKVHNMITKNNILIVDDDPMQRTLLEKFIKKIGHNPVLMSTGQDVLDFFDDKKKGTRVKYSDIDIMLLDISMPLVDGFEVLEKVIQIRGDLPIIMLTALKDADLAMKAINNGAFDYIVKGEVDVFTRLFTAVNNAIQQKNLKNEVTLGDRKTSGHISFSDIVAEAPKMKSIIFLLLKTVDLDIPILLQGENGVGKELIARAIHGSSKRVNEPFVSVNCGALNDGVAEGILFGYEKGFMGSPVSNKGKFREAEGGTLFLDNIEELSSDMQLKILNVLKKGEIEPLGSNESFKINTRIISTATKMLEDEVKKSNFRADLFYRLNVFSVNIPPLKDRKEEIPLLANSFCNSFSITEDKRIEEISPKAMDLLSEYDWPGNIRQLRNAIFRAVILTDKSILDIQHFPQIARNSEKYREEGFGFNKNECIKLTNKKGLRNFKDVEIEIIEKIIKLCNGNISDAAKKLGIGRSTLYRKLKIDEDEV